MISDFKYIINSDLIQTEEDFNKAWEEIKAIENRFGYNPKSVTGDIVRKELTEIGKKNGY